METQVKQLDEAQVELTVTADATEVDKQVAKAYRDAGKARIPGFRPGKAPRRVLDNFYGGKEYFLATATEDLVRATAPAAIDNEGFVTLENPSFNEFDIVEEGKPFTYIITLKIPPRFELSSYEPVKIELPSAEPTDDEIIQRIDSLREYYVEYEEVAGRPVEMGDSLVLTVINENTDAGAGDEAAAGAGDESAAADTAADATADAAADREMPYDLGSGAMPPSFEAGLVGMKVGETKAIEVDFGDVLSAVSAEDKAEGDANTVPPITVTVVVKSIRAKQLPELTDAWVKDTIEYEDVAELKNRVADSIKDAKEADLESLRDLFASQKLAARLEGEPPEELIKQTEQNNYQDFFKSLQDNHATFDQYLEANKLTSEEFREQMHEQAAQNAASALALDSLARHLEMTVSDEEIYDEFVKSGTEKPEELFKEWQNQGRLSEVREGLLRMKAARHLCETAEIFEPGTLKEEAPAKKKAAKKASDKTAAADKVDKAADKVDKAADKTDKAADKTAAKKAPAKATKPASAKASSTKKTSTKKDEN
ncbi:MAG: trigger factor [Coriobacteriia bacterium]|nr:trigger factor [Coriobacteriia bacterium]